MSEQQAEFFHFCPEGVSPQASVIIPVNAQSDLELVWHPLKDLYRYSGSRPFEIILVINNYPEGTLPPEVAAFRDRGVRVVAVPNARRAGEVVIVSARALGVAAARSDVTIHFDADTRIPNVTALIDWYIERIASGTGVAYSHVGYYDLPRLFSVRVKIGIHNLSRWAKRTLFGIPTTRGSNYAVQRSLFLDLHRAGRLSVDLQIGPGAKLQGFPVAYSGHRDLVVLTSGRRFRGGWLRMVRYFLYRLYYNWNAIPTRRTLKRQDSWEGYDRESERRQSM